MGNKTRKRWSTTEKMEILNYYQREGIARTVRQYGLSSTMVYKWQKAFEEIGESGLENARERDKELRMSQLERENRELKAIVAEKELRLRIQEELLKKNQLLSWRKS